MHENPFARTELLLGEAAMGKLAESRVAVFGVGGVGGYVAEALARSGVGALDLIDNDTVSLTNLNRQIVALHSTLGQYKTQVMKRRIEDINPSCKVKTYERFFLPGNAEEFDFRAYSYVVDAVDTVTAKIALVMQAGACGVPVISSMGAGNKRNPVGFEVADLYQTSVCPLAKVMRRELKKRGVKRLKVVYSREKPLSPAGGGTEKAEGGDGVAKRHAPGSLAFVPSVAGLILASEVIRDLTAE